MSGRLRVEVGDSPLRVHHRHLLNTALKRGDNTPERQPDDELTGNWSASAVGLARENWRRRMLHEHQSSAVFSGLVPFLIAAEATLDFKTAALRYAMDELRHAGLCGAVVAHLGGDPVIEADLAIQPLPEHLDCPPLERALRNMLFTSLSETVSVALLTEERERTTEPYIRRVLDQLAGDEVGHARFGWLYLQETWPRLDDDGRARTNRYLEFALPILEQRMLGAMPLAEIPEEIVEEAQGLGFSDSETARSLLFDTLTEVIVPQLNAVGATISL